VAAQDVGEKLARQTVVVRHQDGGYWIGRFGRRGVQVTERTISR
jgi:hypothetical protein